MFLRVALPLLHTFGIEASGMAPPVAGVWAETGAPVHDAGSCPICRTLAHPVSTSLAAPQVTGGDELSRVVLRTSGGTAPPAPAAHPAARAPPPAPVRVS